MMFDFFFPDLTKRSDKPELMDIPDSSERKLISTLKQFSILNLLLTGSRRLIKMHIVSKMKQDNSGSYTFLDIGSGGCDIPIWLSRLCARKKIKIKITCIDNDERVINYAKKKCRPYRNIKIINFSAFEINRMEKFDFIFANHFLHHLPQSRIHTVLKLIAKQTKNVFLINDIRRSSLAYLGYTLLTGIFFHDSFAFYDGRLSIKKGFKIEEVKKLLFGMREASCIIIGKAFPSRIFFLFERI